MKDYTRQAVAYSVGTCFGVNSTSVYDYLDKKYYSFSGDINIYDYNLKCSITCQKSSEYQYQFFHYKHRKHIDLRINNKEFEGFDYDTRKHFLGQING